MFKSFVQTIFSADVEISPIKLSGRNYKKILFAKLLIKMKRMFVIKKNIL